MRSKQRMAPLVGPWLVLFGWIPVARASSVDVLSTPSILEPTTGRTPDDKDGCPPVSSNADPEEGTLQVQIDVTSPILDPNLLLVDSNSTAVPGSDSIDDLTIDDPTTGTPTGAGVVRDLDYLDGADDGELAIGTYYVYFNLDKTDYVQGSSPTTSTNCAGRSFQGDTERYEARLREGTTQLASDAQLVTMAGSAGVRQNDLDWLGTEPDSVNPAQGDTFCIRSKYRQSSAQSLFELIGNAFYNADILRLDHVNLYYYDTNGADPGSIEFGVPGVSALGTIPEESFEDQVYFTEATLASLGDGGGDLSSGDHWVSEFCFEVVGTGPTFFSPYWTTRASSTSNYKVDSGFGEAVVINQANLSIVKECDASIDAVVAGVETSLTHNLEVCNTGLGDADEVVVLDTLPLEGVTCVSAASGDPSVPDGVCDNTLHTITWEIGSLAAGTCIDLPFVVSVTALADTSDEPVFFDTNDGASVEGVSAEDPDTVVSDDTTETCPVQVLTPGLAIDKVASASSFAPGDTVTYTITVTNTGEADLTDVTIEDDPDEAFIVSVDVIDGVYDGDVITWDVGSLGVGESVVVTYDATFEDEDSGVFAHGTTSVDNTAFADAFEVEPVSDSESVDVVAAAALDIVKDVVLLVDHDGDGLADPGDTLLYTLTVDNVGNAAAHSVTVTDDVEEAFIASVDNVSDAGVYDGDVIAWILGDLSPGDAPSVLSYEVTLVDVFPEGTTPVDNVAVADSDETEPVEDAESVPVDAAADVSIVKSSTFTDTDGNGVLSPGDTVHYSLLVSNDGDADATNVSVVDDVEEGAFQAIVTDGVFDGDVITWELGTVAAGTSVTLEYDAVLDPPGEFPTADCDTVNNDVINTATVFHDFGLDEDDETVCVQAAPFLEITKVKSDEVAVPEDVANTATADSAETDPVSATADAATVVGATDVTWTITVTNTGNATATGLTVEDTLAGVSFQGALPSPDSNVGGTLTWLLGDLAVGESVVIDLTARVE